MNVAPTALLAKANEQLPYNLYIRLSHYTTPAEGDSLAAVTAVLTAACEAGRPRRWSDRNRGRLTALRAALATDPQWGQSVIGDLTRSPDGLTACTFTNRKGEVSVVFRGTGKGEWIDNGEGLSGIPEENTYVFYGVGGLPLFRRTVREDYATDQQVEALNWFRRLAARRHFRPHRGLTLSGHSKGGNKAQFVAMHTDLVDTCISFDGQGFSPEAVAALQARHNGKFYSRRERLFSLSAENDYVNVLGERLMPEEQVYYVRSVGGFHYLEAMINEEGRLRSACEQGGLSRFVQGVSARLMALPPSLREYATLGVMNLFQKYLGRGTPVNGDRVSLEQTIAGLGLSVGLFLQQAGKNEMKNEKASKTARNQEKMSVRGI